MTFVNDATTKLALNKYIIRVWLFVFLLVFLLARAIINRSENPRTKLAESYKGASARLSHLFLGTALRQKEKLCANIFSSALRAQQPVFIIDICASRRTEGVITSRIPSA